MKAFRYWTWSCFFGWIAVSGGWCEPSPYWRVWTTSDGLVESWSGALTASPTGRLWVTHGQVKSMSRLDGWSDADRNFVQVYPSPDAAIRVHENSTGQLWSISLDGLLRYAPERHSWIHYPIPELQQYTQRISNPANQQGEDRFIPEGKDPILDDLNGRFIPSKPDRVFLVFPDRLMEYDAQTGKTHFIQESYATTLGEFQSIFPLDNLSYWVAGERGIARLTIPETATPLNYGWKEYPFPAELGLHRMQYPLAGRDNWVYGVAYSPSHYRRVLVCFNGESWSIRYAEHSHIVRGWPGEDDRIWIEVREEDLSTLILLDSGGAAVEEKNSVLAGIFYDIVTTPGGAFWLATSAGLARYTPPLWRTPNEVRKIRSRIHAIHEDSTGRLWFAGQDTLICLDGENWKTIPMPEGYRSNVSKTRGLVSLPGGALLIGTRSTDSLLLYYPEEERFEIVTYPGTGQINHISPARDGRVWLETIPYDAPGEFQLQKFDRNDFLTILRSSSQRLGGIRYILERENGDVWLGGSSHPGLARIQNGQVEFIGEREGFAGSGVFCIHERPSGSILFGDRDRLIEYDGEKWTVLRSHLDRVNAIFTEKDGTLWVASGTGLHRYQNDSWVTYTAEDGLPVSFIYSVHQDRQGRLWTGTAQGLSLYYPEGDREPPETFIRSEENLKETPPGGNVRFLVSGVDKWKQTNEQRLLYSYKMDDGPWTAFQPDRIATFNGLKAGPHTFQARAMDINRNVDPIPAVLEFEVLLSWYWETGFLTVAALGILAILALIGYAIQRHFTLERLVKTRTADLSLAYEKLENEFAERQRLEAESLKIRDQEQRRIGQDLHDGLIQHLTGIAYISKWLEKRLGSQSLPERENASEIAHEIHRAIRETEEIARGLNPIVLETDGLAEALQELAIRTETLFSIRCEFRGLDRGFSLEDKNTSLQLYRIAQECIHNAIRHGKAQRIEIDLAQQDERIVLTIADNGSGFFDPAESRPGMGLHIMKHRARTIGADLTIHLIPDGGTRVTCILPRNRK